MRRWLGCGLAALALAHPARAGEAVVAYTITDARSIEASLTGSPGNAGRGAALFAAEARPGSPGGCAACHGIPGAAGQRSAADLAGLGGRMSPGEIRLWIVAPEAIAPGTAMPPYYAAGQRTGAEDPLFGGPALTAGEVEDLVAYLTFGGASE